MVSELEKLLPVSAGRQDAHPQLNDADTFLKSIPSAIRNIQDLLLHTAAKIDALNERVSTARDLHVDRLRAVSLTLQTDAGESSKIGFGNLGTYAL